MITYTYENRHISHFALKKVNKDCKCNKDRTTLIGVMCKVCPFYEGVAEEFILCSHPDNHDDENSSGARHRFIERLENNAMRAYYE